MIIPNQLVKVRWTNRNKHFYEEKGYTYTKSGEWFDVKAEDLSHGSHTVIEVKCDYCGKIYPSLFRDVVKGRTTIDKDACKDCVGRKCSDVTITKRQETHYAKVLKKCEDDGYKLLTPKDEMKSNTTYIQFECPQHGIHTMRIGNFLSGKRCPQCAKETTRKALAIPSNELEDRVAKCGGVLLNSEDYVNNAKRNLRILCPKCNNEFITSFVLFTQHGGQVCPDCAQHSESVGEGKVRKYLEDNNICFKQHYWFSDCRDINPLPFDFYLPEHNKIIEFDGRQHFGSTSFFKHSQEMTPIHDKIKNDYCKEHKIELLRIPFWKIDKIDTILSKFI